MLREKGKKIRGKVSLLILFSTNPFRESETRKKHFKIISVFIPQIRPIHSQISVISLRDLRRRSGVKFEDDPDLNEMVTLSTLTFTPRAEHDRKQLSCRATNHVTDHVVDYGDDDTGPESVDFDNSQSNNNGMAPPEPVQESLKIRVLCEYEIADVMS